MKSFHIQNKGIKECNVISSSSILLLNVSFHIQNKGIKECNTPVKLTIHNYRKTFIFRTKGLRNATDIASGVTTAIMQLSYSEQRD